MKFKEKYRYRAYCKMLSYSESNKPAPFSYDTLSLISTLVHGDGLDLNGLVQRCEIIF